MALDAKNESGSVSRRTIIKGAAWSAPVMIAAVAVPAAVASVNGITGIARTNPTTTTLAQRSSVGVSFSVLPATFTGTVYLGLSSGSAQHPFSFGSGGTTTSAQFVNGVTQSPVVIVTPNGGSKTATLSASSLADLSEAVALTLST